MDMYITKVKITPDMARDLLTKNTHNRPINRLKVSNMVADIKAGRFELTHQPIGIAEDGELVDGQHRLTAVVEADMPVEMFVAYNAPRSTKIDIGIVRDQRTSLFMAGIIDKNTIEYNRYTYPLVKFIVMKNYGRIATRSLTADEVHAIYTHHSENIDVIIPMMRTGMRGVPVSSAAMSYVLLCAYAAGCTLETLTKWYEIVRTGDYIVESDMHATKCGQSVMLFANYITGKRFDINAPDDRLNEFIKKGMSSIRHFEKKEIITKLYGEICYPQYELKPEDFYISGMEAI